MRKLLTGVLVAAIVSTGLMAEKYTFISGGVGETFSSNARTVKIGVGGDTTMFDTGAIIGYTIQAGYSAIDKVTVGKATEANVIAIDWDIHLGYRYKNVAAYGIAGFSLQALGSEGATGVLMGAGISYSPFRSFGIALEHKTGKVETMNVPTKFDVATTELQLRYLF